MFRYIKWIAILAIVLTWQANSAAFALAADGDWITIIGDSNYGILVDTDLVIVRAPVKLTDGIPMGQVNLKIIDISLGNRHEMRLVEAFKLLPLSDANNDYGPAIQIQVDLKKITTQGAYSLLILATTQGHPDVYLSLTITVPNATLRAVGPIVIDSTRVFFSDFVLFGYKFLPKEIVHGANLDLQETSGNSRLTDIEIQSLGFSDANNRKVEGNLNFTEVPTLIPPKGSASPKYAINGTFPLGTANGNVEVNAPQLVAPSEVKFEVHTRNTPALIILIAILGLAMGFITRTLLPTKIADAENRIKALDLIDQMDREMAKRKDEGFHKQVENSRVTLQNCLSTNNPANLPGVITSAEQELTTALGDLQTRRTAAMTRCQEFAGLVQPPWSVPEEIEQALNKMREGLKQVDADISTDDVQGATDLMAKLYEQFRQALKVAINQWQSKMTSHFENLRKEAQLPKFTAEKLGQAIIQLQTSLAQVALIAPKAEPAEINNDLVDINNIREKTQQVMILLVHWLKDDLLDVEQVYNAAKLAEEPLKVLSTELGKILEKFEHETNLEQAIESLVSIDIPAMRQLWQDFFIPQVKQAPQEVQADLTALLEKCDYLEDARKLVSVSKPKPTSSGENLLGNVMISALPGLPVSPMQEASSLFWLTSTGSRLLASVVPMKFYRQYEMPQSIEVNRYLTMWELANLKLLQFLIVGAGIVGVGYLLYEPNFTGTWAELAQILFWAFGLDVSVNSLIDVAKGVKKSGM